MKRLLCGAVLTLVLAGGAESRPLAQPSVSGWLTYGATNERTGETSARIAPHALRAAWFADVDGMVTTQPLVARNVPHAGQTTIYFGISSGLFQAIAPDGYVRWSKHLGVIPNSCPQLPAWGVTGTPVIDPSERTIFVADAFGWLHALDLANGQERAGWPVQLYGDPSRELVWGALAHVGDSIYAATGSYCDRPMEGKIVRVEIDSRQRSTWTSVPYSLGGGGGIWGWGGVAYSTASDRLYVATGNAFEGGSNSGPGWSEAAGYGEQLVALNRDLEVVAASHAPDVPNGADSDFVGSPVVVQPPGCGELIAVLNKNGRLYVWRGDDIGGGPSSAVVQQPDFNHPLLGNPAYDAALRSFYVVTFSRLVRVAIGDDCLPKVSWRRALGQSTLNSSATVAGNLVWFALSEPRSSLVAFDATTGRRLLRQRIGGMSFAAPTIIDGRLFEDGRHGFTSAGARRSSPSLESHPAGSWIDRHHGWLSRETGVYATDDGGHRWRRIFAGPAARIVRTSVTDGVISVGTRPAACNCTARRLWTGDGGHTWHVTDEIGAHFAGRGHTLVWWTGAQLEQIAPWPSQSAVLRSRRIAQFARPIVAAVAIPGGVAVLLTAAGRGWDHAPTLYLIRAGQKRAVSLPAAKGEVLVTALDVSWPALTVHGVGVDGSDPVATWRSTDAGRRWAVTQTRR